MARHLVLVKQRQEGKAEGWTKDNEFSDIDTAISVFQALSQCPFTRTEISIGILNSDGVQYGDWRIERWD